MSQVPRGQPGPPRGARARPARPTRATYWRRRVVVLAVGIGLITALVWGVNGLLSARRSPAQAALAGHTTAARAHRHSDRSRPADSPSPARSRHRKADPSRPAGPVAACAADAVTLTLSSPQYWYQPGAAPHFTVRARTDGQPCRFRVSRTSVAVVVVSASGHHIWSSADCAAGGSHPVVVSGGTSAVLLRVTWNRRTSAPGCAGAGRLVGPGEYQVSAVAGHLHSSTEHMVLGAAGQSGP